MAVGSVVCAIVIPLAARTIFGRVDAPVVIHDGAGSALDGVQRHADGAQVAVDERFTVVDVFFPVLVSQDRIPVHAVHVARACDDELVFRQEDAEGFQSELLADEEEVARCFWAAGFSLIAHV